MKDLNEMTLAEIIERLATLDEEVRSSEDVEAVNKAAEEKKSLLERKAELEEIEARAEEAKALETGELKADKIVEETRKEEKPMEIDYRSAWLKNLMGMEVTAEERAAVTGADAVIPTETLNKVVVILKKTPLLGKVDMLQIPGYVRIPVYSTNNDASWTTTASDSADALTYIDLKPYQLIKTVEITADVQAMSIPAFEDWLVAALANKIAYALNKAIVAGQGSGSSQPTGIMTTITTATGTFTKAACTKADLLKIMSSLGSDYQENAVWIMPNKVFYGEILNLSNHDTYMTLEDGMKKMLLGHEVILCDAAQLSNVDQILFGDLNHYHMNLGQGVQVSKDASIGFRSNSMVFRGVCQADGQLDLAAAFVRYNRAS